MDLTNIIIETDRLLLIPITLDFAEDIFNEFSWEITKYMYPKPAEKIEETYDFINNSLMKLKKMEWIYKWLLQIKMKMNLLDV